MFSGTGLDVWVLKAKKYFTLNRLTEAEKIEVAGICFEREAQSWLPFEERAEAFTSWKQLKEQLIQRFLGPTDRALSQRLLLVAKQHGSVTEYIS